MKMSLKMSDEASAGTWPKRISEKQRKLEIGKLMCVCVGMHVYELRLASSKGQQRDTSSRKHEHKNTKTRSIWWSYNITIIKNHAATKSQIQILVN